MEAADGDEQPDGERAGPGRSEQTPDSSGSAAGTNGSRTNGSSSWAAPEWSAVVQETDPTSAIADSAGGGRDVPSAAAGAASTPDPVPGPVASHPQTAGVMPHPPDSSTVSPPPGAPPPGASTPGASAFGAYQPRGHPPGANPPGANQQRPYLGSGPPGTATAGGQDAPAPPRRTHRWGLGAYLLVEVVFLATAALIGLAVTGDGPLSPSLLALALAVPTVLAAGTALAITRLRGNGPRIDLGLQWSWRDVGLGLAFGFGGLVVTIPASILYVAIVGPDATSAVGDVFGDVRAGPLLAVLIFVIVVVVAPLCEEIVYRGLLWGGVERRGAGPWVTLAVTTLVFALAHFEFTRTPLLLVVAIPIGLARIHTGRLLASIVAHQVNNLLPGVALLLMLLGVLPTV